jgi:hypothetical protein
MNGQRRDIYLRAHTEKLREGDKKKKTRSNGDKVRPERWPERAVIVDTEVRTTMDGEHGYQALTVGIFRSCVWVNGEDKCESEGIFTPVKTKREQRLSPTSHLLFWIKTN